MPRKQVACAGGCGRMLAGGTGSLPAGERCCRECRASDRNPVARREPVRRMRRCSNTGCDGKHLARGMCRKHYRAWKWANSDEAKALTDVLIAMASLRGAYAPKPKPVKVRLTVGVIVDCPTCGDIMAAANPTDRVCRTCGTTLTLNAEEVSWLTYQARSQRASLRTAS